MRKVKYYRMAVLLSLSYFNNYVHFIFFFTGTFQEAIFVTVFPYKMACSTLHLRSDKPKRIRVEFYNTSLLLPALSDAKIR